MNKLITNLWIGTQLRMKKFCKDFMSEEKGAAEIVAIILIIVVIIAAAVIFRERIISLVENIFGKADEFANS